MPANKSPEGGAGSGLPREALSFLDEWLGSGWTAAPLRGDASVRGYYRVAAGDRAFMVAYYPPELREQAARFVQAHDAIAAHLPVPTVLRSCSFAVAQEDVGDFTLFDLLQQDPERGRARYREAVDLLAVLQQSPAEASSLNPPFDAAKFEEELQMTLQYYVRQLCEGDGEDEERLTKIFTQLARRLTHHPYVLTHRDYHGQNIHIFNDALYVIDYQDLRKGPDTYDLASLLRDRGVAEVLGQEAEDDLVAHYAELLGAGPDLRRRYLETLLQRSIKIVGTFAKQALTRGREHYLEFIPPTLKSIRFCLSDLPEYRELLQIFPLDYRAD